MELVNKSILKEIYKERDKESHKYNFGLLLVIGGSRFYSGSPALSAQAAFKAGVDMVQILAPKRAADIIASFSPNLASLPLSGDYLEKEHLSTLLGMTEAAKSVSNGKAAVVIGGGAGRDKKTQDVILEYLSETDIPTVIDADAIRALAKNKEIAAEKDFLITPHSHEFFVLTGEKIEGLEEEQKIEVIKKQASELNSTLVVKGAKDVISNGARTAMNETGSPYLTKGGTGDTLAGICGALLARGNSMFKVAQAASYINGKAGELAAEQLRDSLTAVDLIDKIPEVIKD